MDVKLPSESRVVALPDCTSDHEELEVSDDDDDDRNHKHRRRETRSQSMERDQPEQCMSRPYRRGKPLNGGITKESDPQSHYNFEREFPPKFEKRRPFMPNSSRFPSDANQRFRLNQPFPGDLAAGRGRGRDSGPWGQRDSRFTAIDIASQMAPHGPIRPAVFAGRGLHSVSNPQSASWAGGFGLIPGIPNGAMDPIHPLGLQGSLRSPLNPSLNMGIPRQRCRDFEERGFCLRGDMCPMEHGVNRIVVEDVQSLSQFNLPVTLPSAHLLGNPAGSGLVAPANASQINSKGLSNRASKTNVDDDGYASAGPFSSMVDGSGADVYDPDQPLWNSDRPQSSTGLALQTPTVGETESFMEVDPSDRLAQSSGAAVGMQSTSSSVWGRMNSSKSKLESREKFDGRASPSHFSQSRIKGKGEYTGVQGASNHGKRNNAGELVGPSSKLQSDVGNSVKKPAHKALRTLFVSCIPMKDNKKGALLSHFKKFGEVIDIYIPLNTDRAFVQFSKREEAEKALKSPDAVMGNRFIKLLWANRDNIADDGFSGGSNMPGLTHRMPDGSFTSHITMAASKENNQLTAPKTSAPFVSDSPRVVNGPKVPTASPAPKKSENLELLREELRKKQEMLEQKRNEFRQQLNKLQKHATGTKDDVPEVQAAKKLKVEAADDSPKPGTPKELNPLVSNADFPAEKSLQKTPSLESVSQGSKVKFPSPAVELSNYKHAARPFAQVGSPFSANRYKLDNRPTSFRVNAPLPPELTDVNSLGDHFAAFGDVSNIELEHSEVLEGQDNKSPDAAKSLSARVCFKTRQGAERAFINGKSWNGHNLQLSWVIPRKPSGTQKEKSLSTSEPPFLQKLAGAMTIPLDTSGEGGSSHSAAKETSGTEIQSVEKPACVVSHDSCGGSQNSAPGPTSFSGAEAQSADKSAVGSREASEPRSADSDVVVQEGSGDGKTEADENINSSNDP